MEHAFDEVVQAMGSLASRYRSWITNDKCSCFADGPSNLLSRLFKCSAFTHHV